MNTIPAINEQEWRPAIYNGRPVKNLVVSNYGFYRRYTKLGTLGQMSRGTPSFNKQNRNRLRQMMVTITFADPIEGAKSHTTVNLHRVICCTFRGDIFEKGDDVDHIDHDVSNGFLGNLRKCTHAENMHNRPTLKPRLNTKSPVAAAYGYRIRLTLGCRRIQDLPIAYQREYHRLISCERSGRPAIPRSINGNQVKTGNVTKK